MVMAGGALGSGLRFLVGHALPTPADGFPWSTFIVNIAGSFFLGLLAGLAIRSQALSRTTLLFLGTGLCGGFTTFSTFSVETLAMYEAGHVILAASYVLGSVVGGLAAAAIGIVVIRLTTS